MRILLFILLSYAATAQQISPGDIYSKHTRLGMNGSIKTVTAYKYTRLKFKKEKPGETKGTIYSVIKNWYDSAGRITQDSTALYYNAESAHGYCKNYTYTEQNSTPVIYITTRFDCFPPYDNKATIATITELTIPDGNTVLAREYDGREIESKRGKVLTSYRFTIDSGLIRRTVFDAFKKGVHHSGTSMYQYDKYGNFTQTTLDVDGMDKEVITHKVLKIDHRGNALFMLNFTNNSEEPEFMTRYEFEYYE